MNKIKLFLVDDERDLIQALEMRLAAEGFRIFCATDGLSALVEIGREHPDLILLDICLPNLDGFDVFQQLRQNPDTAHIPVIFLTARTSMEDRQKARHLGAAGYLSKPFQWPKLLALLRNTLSAGQQNN